MRPVGRLATIQHFFHVGETRIICEPRGTGVTRHQTLLPRRRVKTNLHSLIRGHMATSPPNLPAHLPTRFITQYQRRNQHNFTVGAPPAIGAPPHTESFGMRVPHKRAPREGGTRHGHVVTTVPTRGTRHRSPTCTGRRPPSSRATTIRSTPRRPLRAPSHPGSPAHSPSRN